MDKQAEFSQADLQLLRSYATGGLAIGSGTALATAMLNHWKQLSNERMKSQQLDDDVLTVKVKRPATKQAMVSGGLGLATGALTTLGSYAAVRAAYQEMKKRRMQKLLDEAQVNFAELSSEEAQQKLASGGRPMSLTDVLTASPVAATLLLALGSAGLANTYLKKNFPSTKPAKPIKPRRVVLKYMDDEQEKEASLDEDSGFELMVKTVLAGQKEAHDLRDLVGACASGRAQEVEDNLGTGTELALDLIKGASAGMSDTDYDLGVSLAVRHPVIGPVTKLLASAEMLDMAPSHLKMAQALSETDQLVLAGLFCAVGDADRWDGQDKLASMLETNPEVLSQLVKALRGQDEDPEVEEAKDDLEVMGQGGAVDNSVSEKETPEQAAQRMGVGSAEDDVIDELFSTEAEEK